MLKDDDVSDQNAEEITRRRRQEIRNDYGKLNKETLHNFSSLANIIELISYALHRPRYFENMWSIIFGKMSRDGNR
jgi:hypothetical protein